jgi:hypothetical protein
MLFGIHVKEQVIPDTVTSYVGFLEFIFDQGLMDIRL